jgi:signal transduction histidine kinase
MSKNSILTNEGARDLHKAMEQLQLSLEGILSIAENLVPEKLLRISFKEFFSEWCKDIKTEYSVNIKTSYSGSFDTLEESQKIKTYRVFQSYIGFLLKQTKPTQIDIQFICSENSITIHATDNGDKFNLPVLTYPGTNESEKLKSLAESINGLFSILHTKRKGNEVKFTFNI